MNKFSNIKRMYMKHRLSWRGRWFKEREIGLSQKTLHSIWPKSRPKSRSLLLESFKRKR